MNIFSGLFWKPLAFIMLVCSVSWAIYHAGYRAADSAWQAEWSKRDSTDLAGKLRRESEERAEEQHRQKVADGERERAEKELAQAKVDAADADAAGKRLQHDIANLRKQLTGSEAGRLSAVASASTARSEAGILLAQLLSESDKAAGEYAAEADRSYAAGQSCERTYDAITTSNGHR